MFSVKNFIFLMKSPDKKTVNGEDAEENNSPTIVNISEEGDAEQVVLLTASQCDDETILRAMCHGDTSESTLTSTNIEAFTALVAEKILSLSIPDGSQLVFSIMALIQRNYRAVLDKKETPRRKPFLVDDDTLAELTGKLEEENSPHAKVKIGLNLGDAATHVVAGMNTKNLHRVMYTPEQEEYARKIALHGYKTAVSFAERCRDSQQAKTVLSTVPPIMNRFWSVIDVLKSILPKKSDIFNLDHLLLKLNKYKH